MSEVSKVFRRLCLLVLFVASHAQLHANEYDVHYRATFVPEEGYIQVSIDIPDASLLRSVDFSLDEARHSDVEANGRLELASGRAVWLPPDKNAAFQFHFHVNNQRRENGFDALITENWAIFRGDDLVPSARVRAVSGATSRSFLEFDMPDGWNSINTGWQRDQSAEVSEDAVNSYRFIIDNPERHFDRPTGWMIAGGASARRINTGTTEISVAAPNGSTFHRLDVLVFLNFIWPEIEATFGETLSLPEKLLIVGAEDPMWRGGLSASNSFYVHADRPLVSENGTSTMLHELFHMVTRIRGEQDNDDWIAEGLAEFYAIEWVYRAGGTTDERKHATYEHLQDWSREVDSVRTGTSAGAITAKAVLVFQALDKEIMNKSGNTKQLDDLLGALIKEREISYRELVEICADLLSVSCEALAQVK